MSYSKTEAQVYGLPVKDQDAFENRHYYEERLKEIFKGVPEDIRPNIPGGLIPSIIDRSVSHIFPEGTQLKTSKEDLADVLKAITDDTQILNKLGFIATEGHITGTVALKSVCLDKTAWTLDVYPLEAISVEHDPLDASIVQAIRFRFRYVAKVNGEEKTFWWQERWTAIDYTEWIPQQATEGVMTPPNFTEDNINREASGSHDYGEIPVTVISHKLQLDSPYGRSEITSQLKAYARALSVSLSKVDVASQLITTPAYKRKNDQNKDRIQIKPGAVIDIDGDGQLDTDFAPLEHPATPESVFTYQDKIKALAYESCNVTNPDVEKEMRAGGTVSSVAWKAFNFNFIKKVNNLRTRYGVNGVEAHIQKILRMGHALQLPDYSTVIPEDLSTYEVQLVYPPFFEMTDEEKLTRLVLLKQSSLSEQELGQQIAMLHGIDEQEAIDEIISNIENERALLEPTQLRGG